jgi:hypothetical protein
MLFSLIRQRREANRLAEADADALISRMQGQDYGEARRRERFTLVNSAVNDSLRNPAHWRRVAMIITKRTGRPADLDWAKLMGDRGA